MNPSPEELPVNGGLNEQAASGSQLPQSDSNANLNGNGQSKGAIPKNKSYGKSATPKKCTKINNNVEEITDAKRLNGYSDKVPRVPPTHYFEDYNGLLYTAEPFDHYSTLSRSNNKHESSFHQLDEESCSSLLCNNSLCHVNDGNIGPEPAIQHKADSDSLSSDDNDLLSISDDGCIYTYKGDQVADLPSSFFNLEIPLHSSPEVPAENRADNASPEMDFLEMDFDPGPSGDADSEDSLSNADLENTENLPQDGQVGEAVCAHCSSLPCTSDCDRCHLDGSYLEEPCETRLQNASTALPTRDIESCNMPGPSHRKDISSPSNDRSSRTPLACPTTISEQMQKLNLPWSCPASQRTTGGSYSRLIKRCHTSSGDLLPTSSSNDTLLFSDDKSGFHKRVSNLTLDGDCHMKKTMVWTEHEASTKQIMQIDTSACGATAVLNVLNALRLPLPPVDKLLEVVTTRQRANSSPLTEYLLSRSVAGSTHKDLIEGLTELSNGQIYARFFHMHPERVVNISRWLSFWLQHGAIPIATLNYQKCSEPIADAWHHQMIFGVGPQGIYLTNPLECIEPNQLWPQLCSEPILLVRKEDVVSRWTSGADLQQLMTIKDIRWCRMNVVGQVANAIRESRKISRSGLSNATHIKIPAAYSAGITMVMRTDAPFCQLLRFCPELPMVHSLDHVAAQCSGT